MPRSHRNAPSYAAEMFAFGLLAMTTQLLLLREFLVMTAGNELFLGLFFAAWFLGIFLGAPLGGRLAARAKATEAWCAAGLTAQAALLPLLLFSVRALRVWLNVPVGELLSLNTLCFALLVHLAPFSLLVGFLFPFYCRLAERRESERPAGIGGPGIGHPGIGRAYAIEALGGMIGGAGLTLLLAGSWGVFQIALLAICLAGASFFIARQWPRTLLGASVIAAAIIVFSGGGGALEARSAELRWQSFGAGMRRVAERDTVYQHLSLAERDGQYMLLGNGVFCYAFPDEYTAETAAHFLACQCPRPQRILLVGGDPGLLKHFLKHRPLTLDFVELDPAAFELVEPHLPAADRAALGDQRVRVIIDDGRNFIRQSGVRESYDLIVCLMPDPTTAALNRYYTAEFFQECRAALRPEGVLVISLTTAVNYIGREVGDFTGSVYGALTEAFPQTLVTPGPESYLLASTARDSLTSSPVDLAERFTARGISTSIFTPELFHTLLEPGQTRLINHALRRAALGAPRNSDQRPISALYSLALWGRYSGSGTQGVWARLKNVSWPTAALCYLGLAALGLAPALFARRRSGAAPRATAWIAVFSMTLSGLAAITFSLVLLLAFQAYAGSLYGELGLLSALYFLGLASGSFIFRRQQTNGRAGPALRFARWELGCAALCGICAVIMLAGWPSKAALLFAMFLAGLSAGAEFPLLAQLLSTAREQARRPVPLSGSSAVQAASDTASGKTGIIAGWIESADHLGAAVGAVGASLILLPAAGLAGSLLLLLTLKLLCAGAALLVSGCPHLEKAPETAAEE